MPKKKSAKSVKVVIPKKYYDKWWKSKRFRAPSGRARVLCGDPVSKILVDTTEADLHELAKRLEIEPRWLALKNNAPGIRRMAFGNLLRGLLRRKWIVANSDTLFELHPMVKAKKDLRRVI